MTSAWSLVAGSHSRPETETVRRNSKSKNASVEEMETERVSGVARVKSVNFGENLMLAKSTRRRHSSATEIEQIRRVLGVLYVEQGGRKNIRVIEKNTEKTRRAN